MSTRIQETTKKDKAPSRMLSTTKINSTPMKKDKVSQPPLDYELLNQLTDRAFFIALRMIDIANARPDHERGEPKVGGHPAACASSKHILAAIHLVLKEPEDYLANKPHVSPIDHGLNFLLQNFRESDGSPMTLERSQLAMRHLRHYSSEGEPVFQSYHAEADPDGYRFFPSGSVGIPPVNALYSALGYKFAEDHGIETGEKPTFWCLMGDSEFREGSLMEAMPDAGERSIGRLVWVVDYNRQNLDGTRVINEEAMGGTDADRIVTIAKANGWNAIQLKHGKKRERAFALPGGEEMKRVIDEEMTDFEFQALLGANDPKVTRQSLGEKSEKLAKWLKKFGDDELQEIFFNVGGHDLESLIEVLREGKENEHRPTLIVAYTIKGHGLRCAALSGNHSMLPEEDELRELAKKYGIDFENPFQVSGIGAKAESYLAKRRAHLVDGIDMVIANAAARRLAWAQKMSSIEWPIDFEVGALKFNPVAHTQWMWGQVAAKLDRLARGERKKADKADKTEVKFTEKDEVWRQIAPFFLTMAPDVGSSTNTSPNMNGKLYGDIGQEDFEKTYGTKDDKAPDVIPHADQRSGHLRFEIAEGNCMSAAGSFGKFWYFAGVPFYPAMTIYDFFIKRAHDQFYYNLYWHSHFATIGTPSGVTLAPEGAQHSWKSDFQIPNCVTWEPCFAKELEWMLADTLRRHFINDSVARESTLFRLVTKGLVQKEFSERLKKQPRFDGKTEEEIFLEIRKDVLSGGYALIHHEGSDDYTPGDNVVYLFAMGALVAEAIKASDALLKKGIYANVFVVTSTDLLLGNYADLDGYVHLKETLGVNGNLYLSGGNQVNKTAEWLSLQGARIPIVSVHDGEPGLLDNIGSIVGTKQTTLAIRKTSKSGTTAAIFHLHGIDAEGIEEACVKALEETAKESFNVNPALISS